MKLCSLATEPRSNFWVSWVMALALWLYLATWALPSFEASSSATASLTTLSLTSLLSSLSMSEVSTLGGGDVSPIFFALSLPSLLIMECYAALALSAGNAGGLLRAVVGWLLLSPSIFSKLNSTMLRFLRSGPHFLSYSRLRLSTSDRMLGGRGVGAIPVC